MFVWSHLNLFHNFQCINFPNQSFLFSYNICANFRHLLIIWLIISSLHHLIYICYFVVSCLYFLWHRFFLWCCFVIQSEVIQFLSYGFSILSLSNCSARDFACLLSLEMSRELFIFPFLLCSFFFYWCLCCLYCFCWL